MHTDYISTKFLIPIAPDRYLVRQRLVEKLKYQEGIRLTLLTAPAGFGKTTSIIHSLNSVISGHEPLAPKIAWLSLDEHDNGLVEFVGHFIGAAQQVEKAFAVDLQVSILSGQQPDIAFVAKELINQLASLDTRLHFVLDDFQVIDDPEISELMNWVVEYLPPNIHIILASRKPVAFDLPRWRGRGWLNEVEAKHLRFTLPETEAFLHNTMRLMEGSDIAPVLQERTEGWVVGLQLAAYSIRERDDYRDFLAGFGGGTKYIADYLMAEVFARQSPQIQDFLLKTSITDRFTSALCAAVVNIDLGAARSLLEELEKSDLFVVKLDHEGRWFQYHKLFSEFLETQRQRMLESETISDLHRKAARWYADQEFIVQAIDHRLLVKDYDEVARLMQALEFEQIWEQSVGSSFLTWIPQFPRDKLRDNPQVVVAAAGAFLVRGKGQLLNEMLQIMQDCEETEIEYKLFRGVVLRSTDQEGALELFHQVVGTTTKENVFHHLAVSQTGIVLMEMGELRQATVQLAAFSNEYVNIGIPQTTVWLQLISVLSNLHYLQGQFREAEAVLAQGFEYLSQTRRQTPLIGLLHIGMGQIYLIRNALATAEKHFMEALRWGKLSGIADVIHIASVGMSNVLLARYDEGAITRLDDGYQMWRDLGSFQRVLSAQKAFVHLNLDNLPAAISWAETSGLAVNDRPTYQSHTLYQIYVAVKLRQFHEANDLDELQKLLPLVELLQLQAQSTNHIHHYLNCLIAKSIIYDQVERRPLSIAALYEALELLERTDFLRLFLLWRQPLYNLLLNTMGANEHGETFRRVLFALADQPGMASSEPSNGAKGKVSITNREMEVLTLIALGLTNRNISEQLFISENTLRTHIRNLYRKLGVHNRTQAVKAGQDLGLL